MGRSQQRKGAAGERELAGVLSGYGYDVKRGGSLSFGEVPDLVGLPGIHIEVKRVERLNVGEAMTQAVRDSERFHDGVPALFHRRNRSPWLVTMRLEDWMAMYLTRAREAGHPEGKGKALRGRGVTPPTPKKLSI